MGNDADLSIVYLSVHLSFEAKTKWEHTISNGRNLKYAFVGFKENKH